MKNKVLILGCVATAVLTSKAIATPTCNCGATPADCCWELTPIVDANNNPVYVPGTTTQAQKLSITGSGAMNDYSTGGSKPWYSKNSPITEIYIEGNTYDSDGNITKQGITSIGNEAFSFLGNVSGAINIPDSVTHVGGNAFSNIGSGVTSVTIPDSVSTIDHGAFKGLTGLTSLTIPESVTSVGQGAFGDITGIKTLIIPDSAQEIVNYAFRDTTGLISAVVPTTLDESRSYYDFFNVFYNVTGTIFCPSYQMCRYANSNNTSEFVYYKKDDNGVYELTNFHGIGLGIYYASAEDMSHVENDALSPIACTDYDSCVTAAAAYKETKAAKMAQNGVLCQTKQGCLNLMNMVSDDAYECTTIAACSAAVKNGTYNVNLSEGGTSGGAGGVGSSTGSGKRIYTVEEARAAVEAAGTDTVNFRIRYK